MSIFFHLLGSLLKCQLGWVSLSEVRSEELIQVSHVGAGDPITFPCCLPGYTSVGNRTGHWSWDLNPGPRLGEKGLAAESSSNAGSPHTENRPSLFAFPLQETGLEALNQRESLEFLVAQGLRAVKGLR